MRDAKEFSETVTSYFSFPGNDAPAVNTTTSTLRTLSTARDEAIATLPSSSGAYFRPTAYRGWKYGSSSSEHDYKASSTGSALPRRYWGRTTWSRYSSGVNTSTLYGCNVSNRPAVPGWVITATDNQLNAQTRAQNWDIGQTLGEARETISFITDALKFLLSLTKGLLSQYSYSYMRHLGRSRTLKANGRKFRNSRDYEVTVRRRTKQRLSRIQAVKGSSSLYLAYMYGVLPLLQDVYDAVSFLTDGVNTLEGRNFTVFAENTTDIPEPQMNAGRTKLGGTWRGKWGCKGEVNFRVKSPVRANLDSMGLTSPLALTWELLPLSFVVDWFAPIGAFLRGLSGHWGVTFSHGYRTTYASWAADVQFISAPVFKGGKPEALTGSLLAFDRQQFAAFPIPVPYVKGLDSSAADSFDKTLSLLALAIQRVL